MIFQVKLPVYACMQIYVCVVCVLRMRAVRTYACGAYVCVVRAVRVLLHTFTGVCTE